MKTDIRPTKPDIRVYLLVAVTLAVQAKILVQCLEIEHKNVHNTQVIADCKGAK